MCRSPRLGGTDDLIRDPGCRGSRCHIDLTSLALGACNAVRASICGWAMAEGHAPCWQDATDLVESSADAISSILLRSMAP